MKNLSCISLILLWLINLPGIRVQAQEPVHTQLQDQVRTQIVDQSYTLVDFVELILEKEDSSDSLCSIQFLEQWQIQPEQHSLVKEVLDQDSACMDLLLKLPLRKGSIPIQDLTYEFHLLDPHLTGSGNVSFPEPDSMDLATRQLQDDLIALISEMSNAGKRYPLEEQLLSVIFHEDWQMDPLSGRITKKVRGISPVIWQRRQTADGFPVNDGETGLPVYYKNQLDRLDLRNP